MRSSMLKRISSRTLFVFLHDVLMVPIAWFGAYWLRHNLGMISNALLAEADNYLFIVLFSQIAAYWVFGLYRGIWRFASVPDLIRILKSLALGVSLSVLILFFYSRLNTVPRSIFPLYTLLLLIFLGGNRLIYRFLKQSWQNTFNTAGVRVLIVGAGEAGEGIIRDMLRQSPASYYPIAVVDDNPRKVGQEIHGVRVVGKTNDIPELVDKLSVALVIIAVPSANAAQMRKILEYCRTGNISCVTLPSLNDLASGRISIQALRNISIEDLLGRDPVKLDWQNISAHIENKTIVVTGGGGSIGSELCRQIVKLQPKQLIIVDNSEYALYQIEREFQHILSAEPQHIINYCLIDVTDEWAIKNLFATFHPHIVFHAAAFKQVPLLQSQLRSAIRNNVLGTWIMAKATHEYACETFVLISTDKAVNPQSIMGMTKRAAEIITSSLQLTTKTDFITVRFGNVLNSVGSVVPLFKQQIQHGGPVTVTHPEITRYFMTIPEACQLIMQALAIGQRGEILVLDMGEPLKIAFLAEQLIKLAGKEVGKDIQIEYVGLRPGEKLHEELFYEKEKLKPTEHSKIFQAEYHFYEKTSSRVENLIFQIKHLLVAPRVEEKALEKLLNDLLTIATEAEGVAAEQAKVMAVSCRAS